MPSRREGGAKRSRGRGLPGAGATGDPAEDGSATHRLAGRPASPDYPERAPRDGARPRTQIPTLDGASVVATPSRSVVPIVGRSAPSRIRALNASAPGSALTGERLKRRSTRDWVARRTGWNSAATTSVEPATASVLDCVTGARTAAATTTTPANTAASTAVTIA